MNIIKDAKKDILTQKMFYFDNQILDLIFKKINTYRAYNKCKKLIIDNDLSNKAISICNEKYNETRDIERNIIKLKTISYSDTIIIKLLPQYAIHIDIHNTTILNKIFENEMLLKYAAKDVLDAIKNVPEYLKLINDKDFKKCGLCYYGMPQLEAYFIMNFQ